MLASSDNLPRLIDYLILAGTVIPALILLVIWMTFLIRSLGFTSNWIESALRTGLNLARKLLNVLGRLGSD